MNFYVSRNNENICLVYWFLFYFLGIPYNLLFSNSSFFFFLKHLGTHLLTVTFFLSCYTPMEELLYHCSNLIYWSSCASYKDPFCFVHTNYSNLCEYIFFFFLNSALIRAFMLWMFCSFYFSSLNRNRDPFLFYYYWEIMWRVVWFLTHNFKINQSWLIACCYLKK